MSDLPTLTGVHHVALTVRDLDRSAAWYARVCGFEPVMQMSNPTFEATVMRHPAGLLVKLMAFPGNRSETFDEQRPGLDHLAFAVADASDIDRWVERLETLGVPNSGAKDGSVPGSRLVVFRDPDGIQLECYCS